MLDDRGAAGVHATGTQNGGKTGPPTAIPAVHIAPPGTGVGMSGGWDGVAVWWVEGQVRMMNWCRQDNNPPHESLVESDSRARMSYHNHPKSRLHSIT